MRGSHTSVKKVSAYKFHAYAASSVGEHESSRIHTQAGRTGDLSGLGSTVVGSIALARQANQGAAQNLDEIVVTGIRGSLTSSMYLKREALMGNIEGKVPN